MLDIMGRNPEVEAKGKYVEGWAVESNNRIAGGAKVPPCIS
jgi:hypothetical protein